MRSTIGFGIRITPPNSRIHEQLEQIADKYEYKLLSGIDKAEADVREGVRNLIESYDLEDVYVIKAPRSAPYNFSEEIQEELNDQYFHGKEINFFKFIQEITALLQENHNANLIFFFAYDWGLSTRVRILEGTIDDLIMTLDNPVDWQLPLYDLKTKVTYAESTFPLIYVLKKH